MHRSIEFAGKLLDILGPQQIATAIECKAFGIWQFLARNSNIFEAEYVN